MRRKKARKELFKDLIFIVLGAIVALLLVRFGIVENIAKFLGGKETASFVSGIFWTSGFTIAPSSVVIARIAGDIPAWSIALWGALGAMIGDLILFLFIRDRFAEDILNSFKPSFTKHVLNSFHLGFLKWLSPIIGAFIIASPLPDEFGITLMGLSKTRVSVLMPISFVMNAIGIYAIVSLAGLIS